MDLWWCLEYLSEPKSKLRLPRVTTRLDRSLNQSPQGGLENIDYTSCNGPRVNSCKIRNKYLIRHVLGEQNGGSTDMLIIADDFNLAANFCNIWFETCHFFHIHIECT